MDSTFKNVVKLSKYDNIFPLACGVPKALFLIVYFASMHHVGLYTVLANKELTRMLNADELKKFACIKRVELHNGYCSRSIKDRDEITILRWAV